MQPVLYKEAVHVDSDTGFRYHCAYSKTELLELHSHDYYEFFLTVTGEAIHTANGETTTLPEGSLVFMRPSDVHLYAQHTAGEYIFANLAFSKSVLDELLPYISDVVDIAALTDTPHPPTIFLSRGEKTKLFDLMNTLNGTDLTDILQRKLVFKRILFELFTSYFSSFKLASSDVPTWLRRAVEKMNSPENFLIGLSRFRELCNKSDEHICRCLKAHYNVTPTEFLSEIKLNYLANMLITTNLSITDLCYECGFENASWFYSSFKKKYGLTPKEFRKKHKPKL